MKASEKPVVNVILAGVGGQGSILASHLLADAALRDGLEVRLAETYGAATRGGSVLSHVRIGPTWSPVTPDNEADALVALEPLEALRVAVRFLRPGGWVLLNTHPILPVDVSAGGMKYPALEEITSALKKLEARVLTLDATALALQAGSARSTNVVMLGGLFALGVAQVAKASLFAAMQERWNPRLAADNERAFRLGYQHVKERPAQLSASVMH